MKLYKYIKKIILVFLSLLLSLLVNANSNSSQNTTIAFRAGSSLLLKDYKDNSPLLSSIEQWIKNNYRTDDLTSGYVSITAHYSENTPQAINQAAIQAATLLSYLRKITNNETIRHTFELRQSDRPNQLSVKLLKETIPPTKNQIIYFTKSMLTNQIEASLARYPASTYITASSEKSSLTVKNEVIRTTNTDIRKVGVEIYYRLNKINFDTTYLSNPSTTQRIDSVLHLPSANYIDSLRILGHASPEGPLARNQWLSYNRAEAMKQYLVKKYPDIINPQTIITQAGGENWVGLRHMVENDPLTPMRERVLAILSDNTIDDVQRQQRIERLDNGNIYKNYLLPRYYRYLRTGASLFVIYNPQMLASTSYQRYVSSFTPLVIQADSISLPEIKLSPINHSFSYIRPLALKSNLFFDAATLLNIEIEIPIVKQISILGEWIFPFWGGLGNNGGVAPLPVYSENYTLQMLSGGVEARYWFPRSKGLNKKAQQWGDYNPLNGWFAGIYGGAGLYDFQRGKSGIQGDFYIASGISGGFAHPIANYFHMEYSLGVGYLITTYYNYTMMDGHKVVNIRPDGKYDLRKQSFVGPTKLKVSLVWIPRFKVKHK